MSTRPPLSSEEVEALLELALLHSVPEFSGLVLSAALASSNAAGVLADAIAARAVDADISHLLTAVLGYGHLDVIVSLLGHERADVRRTTAASLRWVWDTRVVDPLLECSTSDPDDQVQAAARRALDTLPQSAKKGATVPVPPVGLSDLALARRVIEWSRGGGTADMVVALNDRTLSAALRTLLGSFARKRAADDLIAALGALDAPFTNELVAMLERLGDRRAIWFLAKQFDTGDARVIAAVGPALEKLGGEASLRALIDALGHGDYRVRSVAEAALPKFGIAAIDPLSQIVDWGPQAARPHAIETLGRFRELDAFAAVVRVAAASSDEHRAIAVRALATFQNSRSTAILADALRADDLSVRQEAARSLARHPPAVALPVVAAALASDVAGVVDAAIDALTHMRSSEAAIRRWIENAPEPVRSRLQVVVDGFAPPQGFSAIFEKASAAVSPGKVLGGGLLLHEPVSQTRAIDPPPPFDLVRFSAIAPTIVQAGSSFVIELWAHLEELADQVAARAREARAGQPIRIASRGPLRVPQASDIRVRLSIPAFSIAADEDTIVWTGASGNATFPVLVPRDLKAGTHVAEFSIFVGLLQAARLHLEIEVASAVSSGDVVPAQRRLVERRVAKAFASYASEDRPDVLTRLQGIAKALPHVDIFVDVISLRSGEQWETRLADEILTRDVFYLFWSTAASRSQWVDKEWRTALKLRGIDYIDPVPLQTPALAPPPVELASLHFNDWTLVVGG